MRLSNIALAISALYGGLFTPASLFANGEQGTWYDPSDLTTLFQDSAGTTPVTGVEQVVGLMLDKSGNGNTATSSGAARPTLRARYNLLTYSEEFDQGVWGKDSCTISANATIAPDGTLTADKVVSAAATAQTGVNQGIGTNSGQFTQSWFVKQAEVRYVQLLWSGAGSAEYANFDLQTGVVTQTNASITPTISAAANGFYRITLTSTFASAAVQAFCWAISTGTAGRAGTYAGNGTDGFFVWGAQLLTAADVTATGNAYQRIAAATVYDTSNAVFRPYLAFGGTQAMSTGSIDFTATDKMTVWAGVTKLSDASFGTISELSIEATSNAGSFIMRAPDGAPAANYAFIHRGSGGLVYATSPSNYAAPITNVYCGQSDFAAPLVSLRLNAAQVASSSSSGGGSYGNYPLYIGFRAGGSLYLNGRLYSLITRGAQSTAAEISATESWVNARTGAF